jgi:O-antigen/teichoic acid export membrane protein
MIWLKDETWRRAENTSARRPTPDSGQGHVTETAEGDPQLEADNVSRTFLGTSTWNAVARGTFLWSSFTGTVIIARLLSPETYGIYALLSVLITYLVVLFEAGLSNGLLRFASDRGVQPASHLSILLSSFALQTALGIFLGLVALLAKPFVERTYRVALDHYLEVGVVIALLTVLRLDLQNLRISAGRGSAIVGANIAFALCWLGGLFILSWAGARLIDVLALQAAAMTLLAGCLLLNSRFSWQRESTRARLLSALPAGMLLYSLAFMVRGIVNQVVMKQTEVFFIGRYRSIEDVAFYDVGYSFAFFALMSMHQAIYPVAIATLTRVAQDGVPKLQKAIEIFYKVLFIHVIPISVVGMMFGDKLVELVYGARMAPAGRIAQIFFGVNTLFFLTAGVAVGMYAIGRPWVGFRIAVAQALLNVTLDLLLIPRFGVPGAILAVLGTLIFVTPFFFRAYAAALGNALVPWAYLARCCAAASLMLVLLPLRDRVGGVTSMMALLAAAGLLYLVGIRLFRLIGETETRLLQVSGLRLANYAAAVLGTRNSRG